jgi:hypothetical protein
MKKLLILLLFLPLIGLGQCIEGDCDYGFGTYTTANGDKYVGEFKDGKKHGKGAMKWADGFKYEGDWENDLRHGKGVFTSPSGDKYVGEYRFNMKNGFGSYFYNNGAYYEGEWKDNMQNGQGKQTFTNGVSYVGELKDDKRHGQGTCTYASGDKYEGEFKDNMMHGRGVLTFSSDEPISEELRNNRQWTSGHDGLFVDIPEYLGLTELTYKKYEGEFRDNRFDGRGVLAFEEGITWSGLFNRGDLTMGCISGDCEDGFGYYLLLWADFYIGEFKGGERNGYGVYYWGAYTAEHSSSVGSKYAGDWENNRRYGTGIYTSNNGEKYEGEYKNNMKNGNGMYISAEIDYEGIGAMLSSEIDPDYIIITKVYIGFPSEKAGLIEGDKILEVNGETAKGKTTQELSSILKGTTNTEINILIERNGNNLTFRFNREKVKLPGYKYTGEFKDDKQHGQGIYIGRFGEKRQGLFENGKFISGECWDEDGNKTECK